MKDVAESRKCDSAHCFFEKNRSREGMSWVTEAVFENQKKSVHHVKKFS